MTSIQWTGDNLVEVLDFARGHAAYANGRIALFEKLSDAPGANPVTISAMFRRTPKPLPTNVTICERGQWIVREQDGKLTVSDQEPK